MIQRVWIYCRTGTDKSRIEVDPLINQQVRLENFAKDHGFEVIGVTAERSTGIQINRRGLLEVMNAARSGRMDAILVSNYNRLCRDAFQCAGLISDLNKNHVDIYCADLQS